MKLSIPIEHHSGNRQAIRFVTGIIAERTTLPILDCVSINGSTIRATNLDVTLFATLDTGDSSIEEAVIDGGILTEIAEQGRDMAIEQTGKIVHVITDRAQYNLLSVEGGMPIPPRMKDEGSFSVDTAELTAALIAVSEAVSSDESRYVLNGVFFEPAPGGRLALVATDGRRLHRTDIASTVLKGEDILKPFILPRYALPHLFAMLAALPPAESLVRFEVDDRHVRIEAGKLVVLSNLVEGIFPTYRQVIPAEQKHAVTVDVPAWIAALEAVMPIADDAHRTVKLSFDKEAVRFFASNDGNDVTATIPIKTDVTLTIRVDPFYLLDALRPHRDEAVTMGITESFDPCTITTPTFTAVIMPKRQPRKKTTTKEP